jgi:hypothetical protein
VRLTNEVKAYIEKRVDQLVPKSCLENQLAELQEAGDEVVKELNAKILALKQEVLDEFVKAHPEALGSEFELNRYGSGYFVYSTRHSELQKELTQANELRKELVNNIVAMVQFDAANCKDSIALDERIVELVNR